MRGFWSDTRPLVDCNIIVPGARGRLVLNTNNALTPLIHDDDDDDEKPSFEEIANDFFFYFARPSYADPYIILLLIRFVGTFPILVSELGARCVGTYI